MTAHSAYIKVKFYVELPDDEIGADQVFDEVTSWVESLLNNATISKVLVAPKAIFPQSFGIEDADTTGEADPNTQRSKLLVLL